MAAGREVDSLQSAQYGIFIEDDVSISNNRRWLLVHRYRQCTVMLR